jgi:hypothetical protein
MSNPTSAPFFQGFNYGFLQKADYFASPAADRDVAAMADLGTTWVALCVSLFQDTLWSTRLYRDFVYTPADDDLARIIEKFHARGIKVLLKTTVETQDGGTRANITFAGTGLPGVIQGKGVDYWQPWFESYACLADFYARLAQRTGCEAYSIACEISGTEKQTEHWKRVIASARSLYQGHLTYNMLCGPNMFDPAVQAWLKLCDSIGMSYYHPVPTPEHPSVAEVAAAHRGYAPEFANFAREMGLPVYFIETGCRSVVGAAANPSGYRNAGDFDGEVQANYYDGMLQAYWDEPWWAGYFGWKWDEAQHRPHYHPPSGETGFTVAGKPAAEVLKRWFSRPRPPHKTAE